MRGGRIQLAGLRQARALSNALSLADAPQGARFNLEAARQVAAQGPMGRRIAAALVADELEKETLYGIDSGVAGVAAGATAVITVRPQRRHVPERLVLSLAVANNFILTDLRVGVEPILATTGTVSCASFLPDSTARPFKAVICEVGTDVTVSATNVSGANARFIANMHGRPV